MRLHWYDEIESVWFVLPYEPFESLFFELFAIGSWYQQDAKVHVLKDGLDSDGSVMDS